MIEAKNINILLGCEESQTVCIEFRKLGFNAFSCDLMECSGGHPEWHLQMDIFEALKLKKWGVLIAFPPCTYLSFAGNAWFNIEKYGEKAVERFRLQKLAKEFFLKLWYLPIPHICLENPRGIINKNLKHSQIIQPYYFGDSCSKTTCLWLKNLPLLYSNQTDTIFLGNKTWVNKGEMCRSGSVQLFGKEVLKLSQPERAKLRSKTFPGIAMAMANQWGNYLLKE